MKSLSLLLPFLLFSFAARSQGRVDVYACSHEIPGFGKLVDQYIQHSWSQGRSLSESQAELSSLARNYQDCRRFKLAIEERMGSGDEQVEQQRQGRRGPRLPRLPRLPQWPRRDRDTTPRIVLVTDEPSARGAQIVQQSFATTAPWSCMGVDVVIEVMDRAELGCQPRNDGRPRIVECSAGASRKAQALRRRLNAKKVLIVVDSDMQGGNGGSTPVITTSFLQHSPKAGMHEIMHTMGFEDTYDPHAQYAATSGDIMSCTSENCYVLERDWGRIARAMNTRIPESCRAD